MSDNIKGTAEVLDELQRSHPPMTAEEELEMCKRFSDDRAKMEECLMYHNIGFMRTVVADFNTRDESEDDKLMRGVLGLAKAASKYDPSKGNRFCTYAKFYILDAFRDVTALHLDAPRMNFLTAACLDTPIKNGRSSRDDGRDDKTFGDLVASGEAMSSPDWHPVSPDNHFKTYVSEADFGLLVDYIVEKHLHDLKLREKKVMKLRLRGLSLDTIARTTRINRNDVRYIMDKYVPKIRNVLCGGLADSEFAGIVNKPRVKRKDSYDAAELRADVRRFIEENRIVISSDGVAESEQEHYARMMSLFSAASDMFLLVSGKRSDDPNFRVMRILFEEIIAKRQCLTEVAKRLKVSDDLAKRLLAKAMRMISENKKGRFEKIMKRRSVHMADSCVDDADRREVAALHHLKDYLFYVGEVRTMTGLDYGRFMEIGSYRHGGTNSDSAEEMQTVWMPYRGGFYSHVSIANGRPPSLYEERMSVRELGMHIRLGNIRNVSPKRMEEIKAAGGM